MSPRTAAMSAEEQDRSADLFAARARAARRRRLRPMLIVTAIAAVLALCTWLLTSSSLFAVHKVSVTGARASAGQVDSLTQSVIGDPMVTADLGALRRSIAAVPAVAAVGVTRSWPNTIRVHITERTAVAAVPTGDGTWQLVDRTGVPFATATTRPADLLVLRVSTPGADDPATRSALAVVRSLPPKVLNRLVQVSALSEDGVRLRLRHGITVVWGGPAGSARKGAALAALLHRHAKVYDVSTPGLVTTSQ